MKIGLNRYENLFKIRKAKKGDAIEIAKVMLNTRYAQTFFPEKSDKELEKIIFDSMRNKIYLVCLEQESQRVVGYFIIEKLDNNLSDIPKKIILKNNYLYHGGVGVHEDFRRKGLAEKLTMHAFKVTKKKEFLGMYADVGSNNEGSIKLQEKCGFIEIIRYYSSFRPKGVKNVVFEKTF